MQKVFLMGMDNRLSGAFSTAFQQQKPPRYVLSNTDSNDVIYVVDADTYPGSYPSFQKAYDASRSVVIATENKWGIPDSQFIIRPLRVAVLFDKLGLLADDIASGVIGGKPKINVYTAPKKAQTEPQPKNTPARPESVRQKPQEPPKPLPAVSIPQVVRTVPIPSPLPVFDMNAGLISHIHMAIRDKHSTTLDWRTNRMVLDITHDVAYSTCKIEDDTNCLSDTDKCVSRVTSDTDKQDTYEYTVENVLWISAYTVAQGRLPNTIQNNSILRLRRWPNLTRLEVWPNTIRICAFLARTPCNIMILTKMLGVDYIEVFNTLSAMCALDLIEIKNVQPQQAGQYTPPAQESQPVVNVEQRGFLSKIMSKIKGL